MFSPSQVDFVKESFVVHYPQTAKIAGSRVDKASRILLAGNVRKSSEFPGLYEVKSESVGNRWYVVDPANKSCTCPDSRDGHLCKHRIAVGMMLSADQWAHEHGINLVLHSAEDAKIEAAQKERSLAFAFAAAESSLFSYIACTVNYLGTDHAVRILEMRRGSEGLEARIQKLSLHDFSATNSTVWVCALDCRNPHTVY